MTLSELRYFVTLAKERHFGRAAKKCFVSQPALSIAIKHLENSVNATLFERNRGDVILTDVGHIALSKAEAILRDCEDLKASISFADTPLIGTLKVGAIHTIAPYLFPKVIPILQKIAPDMPLDIYEYTTDELVEMLNKAEIDVAIMALPIPNQTFKFIPLYQESFVVISPIHHVLSKRKSIAAKEIYQYNPILLNVGHCFRNQVLDSCDEINPDHVQIKNSLETIRNMVASNISISVMPVTALAYDYHPNLIQVIPFADPKPTRKIAMVFRESYVRIEAARILAQAIKTAMPTDLVNGDFLYIDNPI